jgi:hypothetical protein
MGILPTGLRERNFVLQAEFYIHQPGALGKPSYSKYVILTWLIILI